FEIFAARLGVPAPDAAETAAQPGVGERAVEGDGLVKRLDRLADAVLRAQQKTLERDGLRVARRKFERPVQRGDGRVDAAETELQLRDALPAEARRGRLRHGLPRRGQRFIELR